MTLEDLRNIRVQQYGGWRLLNVTGSLLVRALSKVRRYKLFSGFAWLGGSKGRRLTSALFRFRSDIQPEGVIQVCYPFRFSRAAHYC
jgi:hypothetical protein